MKRLVAFLMVLVGSTLMASPIFAQEGALPVSQMKAKISHADVTAQIGELAKVYPDQSKTLYQVADIHAQLGLLFSNKFKYGPVRFYAELCNQLDTLEKTVLLLKDTPAYTECKQLLNHRYYFVPNGEKLISLREAARLVEENTADFKYGFAQTPWGYFYDSFDGEK